MSRWVAPVLSFTADEIWTLMPQPAQGEREESVFLATWYEQLAELEEDAPQGRAFWKDVLAVKVAVNKRIEEERNAGKVKGSLTTEVELFCEGELKTKLESLGEELRFVLISSGAAIKSLSEAGASQAQPSEFEGLALAIRPAEHKKCDRCWHHREEVGTIDTHPDLCGRCVENVDGEGEARQFA